MANLSYCRFENTYRALLDCLDHWSDGDLSESEKKYRRLMQSAFEQYAELPTGDAERGI